MRDSDDGPDGVVERAVDALDDRLYVLDAEGRVCHLNDPALAAAGRPADELVSRHLAECFPEGRADRIEAALSTADEAGAAEAELDLATADGDTATHEFTLRELTADGERVGFVGVARDVSDRVERQRILTDLHRTTRDLMTAESAAEAAEMAVDTLSDLLSLNHTGIHLYDEQSEALVPVAWTDRVEDVIGEPPTLGPETLAWSAFESGEVAQYDDLSERDTLHNRETVLRSELIVPLGDHGVAIVASVDPAAFDDDDRRLAQVLCANLTAALDRIVNSDTLRRRERELERENERLDEFASVVSHDLRNPLNVAQGRMELLREEAPSDHVEPLERALGRMETLIEDVLTLARKGQQVDEIEPVELSAAVEQARAGAVGDNDAVVRVVDDATIYADRSRLTQALENLFRNSVEHGSTDGETDDGAGVTITVGILPDGFYVADDGPGIPPADRDRVLEAGYSTVSDGTGFGLSIVRDIVQAHGWDLSIAESETGGARFEVTGVRFV